jgi:FAD/FMN-containing dehydrogenase
MRFDGPRRPLIERTMTAKARTAKPVSDAVLRRLVAAAGPGNYLDEPKDIAPYCQPWRDGWPGRSRLVLKPRSTEEVAALVAICAETRTPIVPLGGNTGLTGASQPHDDESEVVLSTERLNRTREIDLLNDTITVEAGVILAEVQRQADAANRFFPLSLGAEGSARIGGNLSTNAGGIQVLRYGNARALVLGLEVVLASGEVWNGLKGLRKDNTGYDLKHLFIGAEGTLGIITAAVLKLFPKATARETAFLSVADAGGAVRLLGFLRERLGEAITSFELMSRACVEWTVALVDKTPRYEHPLPGNHPWHVLMEVTGQGAADSLREPLETALAAAMESGHLADATIAQTSEQARRLWQMREDLVMMQQKLGPGIKHDVSVPVSKVAEFLERADAAMQAAYPGVRLVAFGHAGDGNIHYNPIAPADWAGGPFYGERERVNRIVHDIVVGLGGSISAEHGIGRLRMDENAHYKSPVEIELMRALKLSLDPHNIMNPGKVVRV